LKADYDSQADALSIDLVEAARWERAEAIDDTYCHVVISDGHAVNVELLNPRDNLRLLETAANRYGIDSMALQAAARAALSVPDRAVTVDVAARVVA
jgi:uncharacterized protein YuzE